MSVTFLSDKDPILRYDDQTLTEKQKAQTLENIGTSTYYHTTRETLDTNYGNTDAHANANYIWGLYDALMADPYKVQKKEVQNNDGTFANYVYEISTREYPTDGLYAENYGADPQIKKPKYLILTGIHGDERKTCLSTYKFVRDVLRGHNVPQSFREGVTLCVMPVGNPSGIDEFKRYNDNNVDINRNFGWNWKEGTDSYGGTWGTSAASEKETQAIVNWLNSHSDADLFIDFHNNGRVNENVVVLGLQDKADALKQIALRGIDRIIPFWRDVIGYPSVETAVGTKSVIFSYSASIGERSLANGRGNGLVSGYAQDVLGINSIDIETSIYYGNYSDYKKDPNSCPPETIAMGAEALGNILIEFYAHSCEVTKMTEIDEKLAEILQVASFRIETGEVILGEHIASSKSTMVEYDLPVEVPSDAKMIFIEAPDDVITAIGTRTESSYYFVGKMKIVLGGGLMEGGRDMLLDLVGGGTNTYTSGVRTAVINEDGRIHLTTYSTLAGTYRWKAYFWSE